MTRVFGADGESAPRIDPDAVAGFFDVRAERLDELGPTRAVIYQDKHPDLAERRDEAERAELLPRLDLRPDSRVLDVGCGTGRWTPSLSAGVAHYHGFDFTRGLVEYARSAYADLDHVRFSVAGADTFTLEQLGETERFDRVLQAGVLIYLNDEQVVNALARICEAVTDTPRILLREPVAQEQRLSIVEHDSEELEAVYNAIYRTRDELHEAIDATFGKAGLGVVDHGYLFPEGDLNNRAETRQEWFLLGADA